METATLDIPIAKAREEVAAYRRLVRERHVEEDALILRGYKAIASGKKVISLTETIKQGGFSETTGLPKFGIARADARTVRCRFQYQGGSGNSYPVTYWWFNGAWEGPPMRDETLMNDSGLRLPGIQGSRSTPTMQAIVPLVPPALRPTKLGGYHILFEADWQPAPRPPGRDPALLKHVGGDLWALIAMWDLTELERLVLVGRH